MKRQRDNENALPVTGVSEEELQRQLLERTAKVAFIMDLVAEAEGLTGRDGNSVEMVDALIERLGDPEWDEIAGIGDDLRGRLVLARHHLQQERQFARLRDRITAAQAARLQAADQGDLAARLDALRACWSALLSAEKSGCLERLETTLGVILAEIRFSLRSALEDQIAELWSANTPAATKAVTGLLKEEEFFLNGIELATPPGYHTRLIESRKRLGEEMEVDDFIAFPWARSRIRYSSGGTDVRKLRDHAIGILRLPSSDDSAPKLARVMIEWCYAFTPEGSAKAEYAARLLGPWYRDIAELAHPEVRTEWS